MLPTNLIAVHVQFLVESVGFTDIIWGSLPITPLSSLFRRVPVLLDITLYYIYIANNRQLLDNVFYIFFGFNQRKYRKVSLTHKKENTALCNMIPPVLCNLKDTLTGKCILYRINHNYEKSSPFPPHLISQGEIPKNVLVKLRLSCEGFRTNLFVYWRSRVGP